MKNCQKTAKNIKQTAKTIFKLSATALALQICFGAQTASAWHLFGGDSASAKPAYTQTADNNIPVIPFLDLEQYYKPTDDGTFDFISRFDNVSSYIKNAHVNNIEPAFIVARNCTNDGDECVKPSTTNASTGVTLSFGGMSKPDDIISNIIKAKQKLGISNDKSLMLSLGGESGEYISQLAHNETQVEALIQSLITAADSQNIKSLTLDFDLEHYETAKQYDNLMKALSNIQKNTHNKAVIHIGLTLAQARGMIIKANGNNPKIIQAAIQNQVKIDYINGMFFDYGNPKLMTPWTKTGDDYKIKNSLLSDYEGDKGEIASVINNLKKETGIKWEEGVKLGVTLMDGLDDGGELLTPKDAADLSYDFNTGADNKYKENIEFFSFWSAERDNSKLTDPNSTQAKKNSLLHSRSASSGIPQKEAAFINALRNPVQNTNSDGLYANTSSITLIQTLINSHYTGDYTKPKNLTITATEALSKSPTITYKDSTGFKIGDITQIKDPINLISSYLHPTEMEKLFGIPTPHPIAIKTGAVGVDTGYLAFLGNNKTPLLVTKGTLYNKPYGCTQHSENTACRKSTLENYDGSKDIKEDNNLAWIKLSDAGFDWGSSTQKTTLTNNNNTTITKLNFSKNNGTQTTTIYRRLIDKDSLKNAIDSFDSENTNARAIISNNYDIIIPQISKLDTINMENIGEGQSDEIGNNISNALGNPITSSGVVKISHDHDPVDKTGTPQIIGEKTLTVNQGCHNTTITWNPTINGNKMVKYDLSLTKTSSASNSINISGIPTTGVTIMQNLTPGKYLVNVTAEGSSTKYDDKNFTMDHCAYIAPVTLTDSNSITMKQNTTPTHSQMEVFFPASNFLSQSPLNNESLDGTNPIATTPENKSETYSDLYNSEYSSSGSQLPSAVSSPSATMKTDNISEIKFDVVAPTLSSAFPDTDSLVNLANVYPQSPITYTGENVSNSDGSTDPKTQRDNDYSTHSQSDKLFDGWFIANKSFWKTTVTQDEIIPPKDPKTISANKDYPNDFTNNKSGIYYGLVSGFSSQYSQIKMALAAPQQTTEQQQGNLTQMTHMTWSFNANESDARRINDAYTNEKSNPSIASQFVLQNNQGQDIWQVDTQQGSTKICNKKTDSQLYTCEIPLIWAPQVVVADSDGKNQNKGSALLTPQACAIWPTNLMQAGTPIHCDPQSTDTGIKKLFTNGYSLSDSAAESSATIRQNNNWGTDNTIVNFLLNSQGGLGNSYLYKNIGQKDFNLHVSSLSVQNTGTTRYTVTYKPVNDVKTNDHETNDENYNLTNTLPLKNILDTINKSYNTYRAVSYKDPASTSAGLQDGRHGLGFVFDLESPNSENYMTPTYVKGTMSVFSKPLLLSSKDKNPPAAKFYPKATPTPLITGANDKDDKSHIKSCTVRIEATGGAGGTSTKTAQSTLSIQGDIFLSTEACKSGARECASTNNDATINGDNYYLDLSNFKDNRQNLQIAGAKTSALMTSIEDYVDDNGKSIVWDDEAGTPSNPSYHKLYGITRGPLQTLPEAQLRFGFGMNYAKNTDTNALDHWNNIKKNKTVDLYYNLPMKSESGFQENSNWYNDINSHNRVNPYKLATAGDAIHNYYKSDDSISQTKPNIGSVVQDDQTTGNEIGTMGDKIQCQIIYSTRNEDVKPTLTLSNATGVLKNKGDTASITATVTNAPEDCTSLGSITAAWTNDSLMPKDVDIDKTVSRGNDKWVQSGDTCVRKLTYTMSKPIDDSDNRYFPTLSLSLNYSGNTYTATSKGKGIEFDGSKLGTVINVDAPTRDIDPSKYPNNKQPIGFSIQDATGGKMSSLLPPTVSFDKSGLSMSSSKWIHYGSVDAYNATIIPASDVKPGTYTAKISFGKTPYTSDITSFTLTVTGQKPGPKPNPQTIKPSVPSLLAQGANETITFTAKNNVATDNTITLADTDTGISLGDCTIKNGTQSTDCTLTANSDATPGKHQLNFTDNVTGNTVTGTSVTVTGNTPKPGPKTVGFKISPIQNKNETKRDKDGNYTTNTTHDMQKFTIQEIRHDQKQCDIIVSATNLKNIDTSGNKFPSTSGCEKTVTIKAIDSTKPLITTFKIINAEKDISGAMWSYTYKPSQTAQTIKPSVPSLLAQGANETITFTAKNNVATDNTITLADTDTGISLGDCTIKNGTQSTDCTLTANSDATPGEHQLNFTDNVTGNTVRGTSVTVTGNTPKPPQQCTPWEKSGMTWVDGHCYSYNDKNYIASNNNPDAHCKTDLGQIPPGWPSEATDACFNQKS